MGVYRSSASVAVDPDTLRLVSQADVDLSNYLDFDVDDGGTYTGVKPKVGDLRIQDPDDSGGTDYIQFTVDPNSGGFIQKTSRITDGNIFEIAASGTYDGSSATVDINYIELDLDGIEIDDGAANAITLKGINVDFDGLTATAVTLSSITGLSIDMPSTGAFSSETALEIFADKGDAAQGAVALASSRDLSAVITADRAISNWANVLAQIISNTSAGDFDISDASDSGILKLQLSHTAATTVGAKTDPDVMQGTALLIDIDAVTNDANTKLDAYPRAIDIAYTLTETLGTLRMAATDIIRVTPTIPTGLSSAGAFQFDVFEINLDNIIANDINLSLNAIYIDGSGLTNTSSSEINFINLVAPDDSNIDNLIKLVADVGDSALSQQIINASRDLNAAISADRAVSNFGSILSQVINNTSAGDFDVSDAAASGVLKLEFSHTAATTVGAKTDPDTMQGTALLIDIDAVVNDANTKLDAYPRAIDIAYTLTETAGTLRWAATDIIRINFDTTGTLSSAGAASINMLLLDADGVTIDDSNISMDAVKIDMSSLTLTDASSLHGLEITIPTLVGQATTRYGFYATDGTVTSKIIDGSMGITSTGINDELYFNMDDFDYEAAAITLDAGKRGDEWTFGGTNGSADDVTFIQAACGAIRLETDGADDDSVCANHLSTAIYTTDNPIIEFRVKVDAVTANLTGFMVGFTETASIADINNIDGISNDYIAVGINSDLANPANARLFTNDDNAGDTVADLGVALSAGTWCTIRIDCTDTEQPRIFVNNTGGAITPSHEIAAATIGAGTIQAGIYMIPFIFVQCLDATPSARHIDVDYIKIWQTRA